MMQRRFLFASSVATVLCFLVCLPGAMSQNSDQAPPNDQLDSAPTMRVQVVSRTTKAVNYRHRGGSTMVDFHGTDLMPQSAGKAKVDSKAGRLDVDAKFEHLLPASK